MWFVTRYVAHRPSILKVKVLNFRYIKVTCNAAKKPGFPVKPDEKIRKN